MKSIRFSILCFLACLSIGLYVQAQQPSEPTADDRPFIDKLSVDPLTGHITIEWGMPETHDPSRINPDKFVLYWREIAPGGTSNHAFDTIHLPAGYIYTFDYDTMVIRFPDMPDPRKTSVPFTVVAVEGTEPDEIRTLLSIPHYNIQVNNYYDSCRSEIRLNWYRYRIWQANTEPKKPLKSYHVMRIDAVSGVHEEIKELSESDTMYIVRPVSENDKYIFYIKAKRSDGAEVTGYHTYRETDMPLPPSFITAVGTEYNGDELAEVGFKLDSDAETHMYEFLGSSNPDYSFVSLGTYNIYGDTVLTDIQKRERTYYYKLEAWHVCKNKYINTPDMANMATALWLSYKQDGPIYSLYWEPYSNWGGEAQYEIYRKISDHPEESIAIVADPATTEHKDDMSGVFIDGDVCYRLIAKPLSPNLPGQQEQAISNRVCIIPESDIFIPQAFTPNVAGINSEFKPFFSYPPKEYANEYTFIVYDRTGPVLFEVRGNSDIGWDGRLKNGKLAGEGVYVYYIKFRTDKGRLVEKKGTFSLLLP